MPLNKLLKEIERLQNLHFLPNNPSKLQGIKETVEAVDNSDLIYYCENKKDQELWQKIKDKLKEG